MAVLTFSEHIVLFLSSSADCLKSPRNIFRRHAISGKNSVVLWNNFGKVFLFTINIVDNNYNSKIREESLVSANPRSVKKCDDNNNAIIVCYNTRQSRPRNGVAFL